MYTVSTGFQTAIKEASRIVGAKVEIGANVYYDENIISLSYEDTSNPSNEFEIGSVSSSSIKLSLMDVIEVFETATYKVSIGIEVAGVMEYVPLGTFYADDVSRVKNVTHLTLFDRMIKLEQAYFSDLVYTATITDVMNEICTKTGSTFVGTLPAYYISEPEGYTYREVVGFIAQMVGGFAKFDRDGNLRIVEYTSTANYSVNGDHYIDYKKKRDSLYRIDKITVKIAENNVISQGVLSAGGVELSFENPLFDSTILSDIFAKLNGFSYLPTWVRIQGNPAIECGDRIELTTVDNEIISIPVMRHKLTFSGGLIGEIDSEGESQNNNSFSSSGSITKKVDRVVTEQILINDALINKANIEDLNATNARIDNLVVTTAMIEDLAVTTAKIADASIVTAKIGDAQITTAKIATGAITNALIGTAAVNTAQIADGSITDAKIVELTANKITAGTLSVDRLLVTGPNSVLYQINVNSVGAVSASEVTLDGEGITPRSITADKIVADSITAAEIATATITANEMVVGTITAASGILADAAITTAKIADAAITNAKIQSLDAGKITSGYISAARIAADTITAAMINVSSLSAITANLGTVTAGTINGITINSSYLNVNDLGYVYAYDGWGNNVYLRNCGLDFHDSTSTQNGYVGLDNSDGNLHLEHVNNIVMEATTIFMRRYGTNSAPIRLDIAGDGSTGIEIRSLNGSTPFLDFSNDATSDFDARFILASSDMLDLQGSNLVLRGPSSDTLRVQGTGSTSWAAFYNTSNVRVGVVGKGSSSNDNLFLYSDNGIVNLFGGCLIDTGGTTTARWQVNTTNYILQNTTQCRIYFAGAVKHTFASDGSKSGGSIEVEGVNLGMSPVDSPQMNLMYVEYGINLTLEGVKVYIDPTFLKTVDNFDVWPNRGEIVEVGLDYFIVKGEGKASCQIMGERTGYAGVFYADLDSLEDIKEV